MNPNARIRVASALVLLALLAPAAFADGGSSRPSTPATPPPETARPASPEEQAAIARQKAEATYASAYKDVEKAQKELEEAQALRAGGDPKNAKKADEKEASATKKLKKSAGQFEQVVAAIPDHANAWNMLGYSRRMSGDLDGAFTAYWKCLEIDPQHAGAHEYLGEAYLKSGKLREARGELAFLEKKRAPEAAKLAASIEAWVKANPDAAKAAENASVTPPPVETK
jgi:tetratricopeptide (TPR) repeat protein